MRVDTGLQDGVGGLRQDDQLIDLTLKVDSQEFRVHKVVLAAVSDYFHAMLCGSLKESKSDIVELKEVSAEQMSQVLDFIYTGNHSLIKSKPKEMLECGHYFQIPKVIGECQQLLTSSLCVSNCLELLSLFLRLPVGKTAQTIGKFIKDHLIEVMEHFSPQQITPEVIAVFLDNWKKSEWDLFQYLTSWYKADCDNRKMYMDDFLSHVRFKLMTPDEVTVVKETVMYAECDGTWKGLVDKAITYNQLPIHKKVLDTSVQSHVRSKKSVVIMNIGKVEKKSSGTYVLCKNSEKNHCWKRYEPAKPPKQRREYPTVIEVNNFLVMCSQSRKKQHWEVFDPRTLTWYDMAKTLKPKQGFAIVHDAKHLYVLGGYVRGSKGYKQSNTSEMYDFDTDTWKLMLNMPVAVASHAACLFQGKIYISGGEVGRVGSDEKSTRMDCLDISTQTWESKAPMLKPLSYHNMCVMKINKKESIVTITRELDFDCYEPETDQWTTFDFSITQKVENVEDPYKYENFIHEIGLWPRTSVVVRGNTLYLLQVLGCQFEWYDHDGNFLGGRRRSKRSHCVKLIVPDQGSDIQEIVMTDIPLRDPHISDPDIVGSLLAFPARSTSLNS